MNDEVIFDFLESVFRATYRFHYTNIDTKDGETTFNSLFVFPFLQTVAILVAEGETWCKAGFRAGEALLGAMDKQLKKLKLYKEDNYSYLADGIIRLFRSKILGDPIIGNL